MHVAGTFYLRHLFKKNKINFTSNNKRACYIKRQIFYTTLKLKLNQYTHEKIYKTLDKKEHVM